ncbi:hypothetical protein BDP27DRAFT_1181967, partial [Rhodocollybia butyracea]
DLLECGFPEDVLCCEWEAQVKAQTKPLPHKSFILILLLQFIYIPFYLRPEKKSRKVRKQWINKHTQDSVKRRDPAIANLAHQYNKLFADMQRLIQQKKAPRNSVAPLKIEMEGV